MTFNKLIYIHKVVFPKTKTVHYERERNDGLLFVFLGLDTQGITFMASKFSIIRFLCALDEKYR